MIIIIYGNGLTAISKKISEIKAKFEQVAIQEFFGKQIDFDQAVIQFSTGGLFAQEKLVVLDDFDPSEVDLAKLTDPLVTVVLKFGKNLPANSALLKKSQTLKAEVFNLTEASEENLFPFLDKLADKQSFSSSKNPNAMADVDHLLDQFGAQYLLTMIFYMLRRMIQPNSKLPSFVQQKIAKQKQNFPGDKIAELYKEGLETDFKIKSGLIEEKMGITLLVNRILTI